MKWFECKRLIRADYIQLVQKEEISSLKYLLGGVKKLITNASFKMTFWFRIGSYLKDKRNPFYKPLYWMVQIMYKHYQYKTGCQLYLGTKVGGGLVFPHWGCQIIHYAAELGDNVQIFQGVTIGTTRGKEGFPKIGNNVILFSGARVIGGVTIGDNCVVGACAVVTKDVPSGSVVAGIPARVVSQKGEEITKLYIY